MSEGTAPPSDAATTAPASLPKPKPEGNPAFKALGLPNFRFKLPSRNWLIFLSITGSWTAALLYDRRQTKKNREKWCTLVSHIAKEPLPTNALARKVTIVLAGPPGDGLRSAREHFVEYVKPVLVAAALEWDVIEGRREGEVRAGLAERTRRVRRKAGEHAEAELEWGPAQALEALRERTGVQESREVRGDIVIGRHTWKEYVRGVHEGWLGPMDAPKQEQQDVPPSSKPNDDAAAVSDSELSTLAAVPSVAEDSDGASPAAATPSEQKPEEAQKTDTPKTGKPPVTPAYIFSSQYADSSLPSSIPSELPPATAIPFPHILGFLNTPIRMYRFLNRRQVADETGRQAAAAVFALYRPYNHTTSSGLSDSSSAEAGTAWEQESVLAHEERDWHKDTKKRADTDGEREWLDDVVLDPRIAEKMRRFQLEPIQEERAKRIAAGNPGLPARHGSSEGEGAS